MLQFTTIVGDDPEAVPTRQAYTKASLRSLRHAFIRSGGKTLGYEWVSPVMDVDHEGDDVRTNLGEITRLVEEGHLMPNEPNMVLFENAASAFKEGEVGECVVKILA